MSCQCLTQFQSSKTLVTVAMVDPRVRVGVSNLTISSLTRKVACCFLRSSNRHLVFFRILYKPDTTPFPEHRKSSLRTDYLRWTEGIVITTACDSTLRHCRATCSPSKPSSLSPLLLCTSYPRSLTETKATNPSCPLSFERQFIVTPQFLGLGISHLHCVTH